MSNKFWKGMVVGAIAGGALTLFHKETRQAMQANCKKTARALKNPKETATRIWTSIEQISDDIAYITDKVVELREVTPQVSKYLKKGNEGETEEEQEI